MRSVRFTIEYDGTDFCGWQSQKNGNAVQDLIEKALYAVTGETLRVHGAGRTDAGVHALGQVAHFRTAAQIPALKLAKAVNAHLPPAIVVRAARDVAADFHARFGAASKRYRYVVNSAEFPPAVGRFYEYFLPRRLRLAPMRKAIGTLVGKHDFKAFQSATEKDIPTVKNMLDAAVFKKGTRFVFEFEAEGFLYKMVRNLVGTLLLVGTGKIGHGEFAEILASRDRRRAGPTAPGRGLTLLYVKYDGEADDE